MRYIVVGGRSKEGSLGKPEWTQFDLAKVMLVDVQRGRAENLVEYVTPEELSAPDDGRAVLFKAGTFNDGHLYLCTQTEVLVYSYPDMELERYLSLPCFNDLHHVLPTRGGNLLVVSTGLDMVFEIDSQDRIVREWATITGSGWERFDRTTDYRLWSTTKPHLSHPNYVFVLDGDYWVTRFEQRDALCLADTGKSIPIGQQAPHDGHIHGNRVFFTTVDGHVISADTRTHERRDIVDLNEIEKTNYPLGWCRGLHVLDHDRVIVGFSRIRPTRFRENLRWVRHKLGSKTSGLRPSRIAQYDLRRGELEWEFVLEEHGLNAIFSIHPVK